VEEMKGGRKAIIVTELPYQVNKSSLLENIARLVNSRQIEGISDIRDESDRKGMRIVLELKRDANEELVTNQLYKHTNLQVTFGVICLALVNNIPKILSMPELLHYYVEHRKEIVTRRTKFDLTRAEERAHIVEGLRIALENLDQVVKTIKQSKDRPQALVALVKKFKLTEKQANAILDMRLHQLTGLEREKLENEYLELIKTIEKLRHILGHPRKILEIIKNELTGLKEKYGDKRRTKIQVHTVEYEEEDLIPNTEVVVSISHNGYIKRQTLDSYRAQLRGGRGIRGTSLGEGDFVEDLFITTNHCYILFFTSYGRVHWKKVYQIPEASRQAKGRAIANLLSLQPDEKVSALFSIKDLKEPDRYLLMVTENGMVKKTALAEYSNPRRGGIIAIRLRKGDHLIDVKLTDGKGEVFIATQRGMAIHFSEKDVRAIGRAGQGVRGIRLGKGDRVIGSEVTTKGWTVLTVTEKGMGKRTDVSKYRLQRRGGKGVTNQKITTKTGNVVVVRAVRPEDEILAITAKGVVNRQMIKGISVIGRATQGVRVVRLDAGDKVVSVGRIAAEEASEESKK
jgi:DNA gyrase subunit A